MKMRDLSRWAGIIAAARDRLAASGERLDIAFGRVRDRALKPDPDTRPPRPPQVEKGRELDNGAATLGALKPPPPEPKRPRDIAAELLEACRRYG